MAVSITMKELLEAGVHFGHQTRRWNPKMKPFIFGARNGIHIIDLQKTVKLFGIAYDFLTKTVSDGYSLLYVGTKKQAHDSIIEESERCGMFYVVNRWLGGTLTNFRTIRSRLARLEELEAIEAEGMAERYSKKMVSTLTRELRKTKRNLDGIRNMSRLPGALVRIDLRREYIAAREARKLGIPVLALIDTDSDPDNVDIPIPGNDDAMRAIELVLQLLGEAIEEGKRARPLEDASSGTRQPARRSSRVTARAEAEVAVASTEEVDSSPQPEPPPTDSAAASS